MRPARSGPSAARRGSAPGSLPRRTAIRRRGRPAGGSPGHLVLPSGPLRLAQLRAADPHGPAVVSADPADPLPVLTDPGVEDAGQLPGPPDRDGRVDALDGVSGPVAVRVVPQLELGRPR